MKATVHKIRIESKEVVVFRNDGRIHVYRSTARRIERLSKCRGYHVTASGALGLGFVAYIARQNKTEAQDDLAKAKIEYDDAFERFQIAMEEREPEETISRLREEAETAAGRLEAAQLDYQEVSFVWNSMWN